MQQNLPSEIIHEICGSAALDHKMSSSEDEIDKPESSDEGNGSQDESNHSQDENNDNQDENNDSQDESNDASSESSDEAHEQPGFLDVMAAEGSPDEDSDDGTDAGSEPEFGVFHYRPDPEFPQFLGLPFELRRRIWELYCPELRLKPRVLDFTINPGTARHRDPSWPSSKQVWTVTDGLLLADMTSATRTVLSIHSESRAMALAVLTDTLALDAGSGDALVRFNPEKDLVRVRGLGPRDYRSGDVFHLVDFADRVKNLSLPRLEVFHDAMQEAFFHLLDNFANLETVFLDAGHFDAPSDDAKWTKHLLKWCTSDLINHHFIETFERSFGLGENMQYIYCWPDLLNHKDFAKVSIDKLWCEQEFMPAAFVDYLTQRSLEYWPVVSFDGRNGSKRYESLFGTGPDFDNYDTSDSENLEAPSEESHTDLDAYESDGIDDAEVLETFDDSDDGNLSDADRRLAGYDSGDGDMMEAHFSSPEAASHSGRESSPVIDNRGELSDADVGDAMEARFSSPEAESASDAAPSPVNRGRKRRIVSDSDDDDEEEAEEPASKRARMAHVVLSDSEDEPVFTQQTSGSNRSRGRQVLSDSDDEDEEDGGVGVTPAVEKKAASSDDEDDSDSESDSDSGSDDSDEDDEDEKPTQQLSLAERLRLHRETNPVADDENESSGTVDVDEDEDDEEDESGLLLRMAEDESGSDDDEEQDYGYDDLL